MSSTLPPCQLVEILHRKAEARSDVQFSYLAKLEDLRARVSGEVRFINQLFPEYTPHDEEYHLSRLFHVADTLIERGRYDGMNATELFVLACGLYAHDWGMAVSENERFYIVTGAPPAGTNESDFALLPNETTRFKQFLSDRGLNYSRVREEGVADEDWREYVRLTHAIRSAERIRQYFANVDPGIAEASARVCEGHWLDFEKLQDYVRYPTTFSVLRESLNLAALAVYVRLVDLLDIASDRTPYVIWKFVAPRNSTSRMEWAKHQVLQPVTCPPYLNGRLVLVDGSTHDHEVFAALEDLKLYCETQVRGCTDLLSRLGDTRHQLDLYHVEWRVAARGFEPVPIRFEFERDRVFEILSDDIYQGDAHVFLRELLQNSIDAIRLRREFLQRMGIAPSAFGLIRVEVQHGQDRSARVEWTDDGSGMDAYIVRNYLAVAGKSFYRSEDFKKLRLPIDPISRFGIGILSCFMVADEIEIETYKDPYTPPSSEPLRIHIPSVKRQFRVEKLPIGSTPIGTKVVIHVNGRRLPQDLERLEVTRYLKEVAGFVEFPIMVTENGRHTIILHPDSGVDPACDPRFRNYMGEEIDVHRLFTGISLENAIVPQDADFARAELVERSFDLRNDLGITYAEGKITFLILRKNDRYIRAYYGSEEPGLAIYSSPEDDSRLLIRWTKGWSGYERPLVEPWSRSATTGPTTAIYRDGILVAEAQLPESSGRQVPYGTSGVPVPRHVINLQPKHAPQIDVARTRLRGGNEHWYDEIRDALEEKLSAELITKFETLGNMDRFYEMGSFLALYRRPQSFLHRSIRSHLPVCFIGSGGLTTVRTWASLSNTVVKVAPGALGPLIASYLDALERRKERPNKNPLCNWQGEDVLCASNSSVPSLFVNAVVTATRFCLEKDYHLGEVTLLTPPVEGFQPLVQENWHPGGPEPERSLAELKSQAIENPLNMSARDRASFLVNSGNNWGKFAIFPDGTNTPFSSGGDLYNLAHPVGTLLFRTLGYLAAERQSASNNATNNDARTGRLRDAQLGLLNLGMLPTDMITKQVEAFLAAADSVGLPVDFASTIEPKEVWYSTPWQLIQQIEKRSVKPFGQPCAP